MEQPHSSLTFRGGSFFDFPNTLDIHKIRMVLEVPYIDHPYLIGPRGRNTQILMKKHDVLLHFPDINRFSDGPKLNHILVYGTLQQVENLRHEIRERMPIRISVNAKDLEDSQDSINKIEEYIKCNDKSITVRTSGDGSCCAFKAPFSNAHVLSELSTKYLDPKNVDNKPIYMIATPILPLINCYNLEMCKILLEFLNSKTSTSVFYPPEMINISQAPYYFIQGSSVDSVMATYNFLIGLSMSQLMFVVPFDTEISQEQIRHWRDEFLVDVCVEYYFDFVLEKPVKRVNLRYFEFCCKYAYMIRCEILKLKSYISNDDFAFMDEVRHLIPSSVFDTCQLFFPSNFCDTHFSRLCSGKKKYEIFKEFYGKVPTFGINKNIQLDWLSSQVSVCGKNYKNDHNTSDDCNVFDNGNGYVLPNQHSQPLLKQNYTNSRPVIPPITILPTSLPAILSGTSNHNQQFVFYSINICPKHNGYCSFEMDNLVLY